MKEMTFSTASEQRLLFAWQRKIAVREDGFIGPASAVQTAVRLGVDDCWPLTLKLYSCPVIVCKDILPIAAKGKALSAYPNAISGSFAYNDGSGPASILYANGRDVRGLSCHYYDGLYPESVIYRTTDGRFGCERVQSVRALAAYQAGKLAWAVGGMGLTDYNPKAEGFTGAFSDVLRKTNHTVLGIKDGMVYLCYMPNMTGASVQAKAKTFQFEHAIMLDGGHIAAINGDETFARINRGQKQQYIIQAR